MGGWAFWANRMHPMPAPLLAGLLQGVISATITIGLQWIINRVHGATGRQLPSILTASLFSLCTISGLHWLGGTPEILTTIALPWSIGVAYIVLYTRSLHQRALA
jgi:hypothetical protein